jgi:alpha-acetolactate decarboxylase
MAEHNTDVYHITIAGTNPHEVVSQMEAKDSPFYDPIGCASVSQHIMVDEQLVGGIVEVWTPEHLTPAQERFLEHNPHVIDVRHVFPEP